MAIQRRWLLGHLIAGFSPVTIGWVGSLPSLVDNRISYLVDLVLGWLDGRERKGREGRLRRRILHQNDDVLVAA